MTPPPSPIYTEPLPLLADNILWRIPPQHMNLCWSTQQLGASCYGSHLLSTEFGAHWERELELHRLRKMDIIDYLRKEQEYFYNNILFVYFF